MSGEDDRIITPTNGAHEIQVTAEIAVVSKNPLDRLLVTATQSQDARF